MSSHRTLTGRYTIESCVQGANPAILLNIEKCDSYYRIEMGSYILTSFIEETDEHDLGVSADNLYHVSGTKISRIFRNGKVFLDEKGKCHTTGIRRITKLKNLIETSCATDETYSKIKSFPIMPSDQLSEGKISEAKHFNVH